MGRDGSQSPQQLLPDRANRSDRNPESHLRRCSFNIQSPIRINNQQQQQEPQQSQTPWFGSLSPTRRTCPPSTSGATADGFPLYPCLPLPYNCHQDSHNANHHNGGDNPSMGGIMALTNFGLGGNNRNQGNTPPQRKLTFNMRSPQIAPINTVLDDTQTPPYPPQTPPGQQCAALYQLRRKLQWLVPIVLMVQSIIFVITMYENDCPHTDAYPKRCVLKFLSRLSFQPLNENPLLGPSYRTLLSIGALNSHLVTSSGQGWRLLTAIWLHAGLFHLLANMLGLISLGSPLEKEFGWIKVALIYLIAGFGGSLLSALFMVNQVSVGASGALMGLLGATIAEILINWSTEPPGANNNQQRSKALVAVLLLMTLNLTFGLMPHVDNFSHIGGLCAGALLGCILLMRPRSAGWISPAWIIAPSSLGGEVPATPATLQKHSSAQNTVRFIALGLLVFSYAMGILALFKGYALGARRTCRFCKYMSCIPSFLWRCHSP